MYQIECTKAQYHLVSEVGHEHTHESDIGKIRYATNAFPIRILKRNANQIPLYILYFAVTQGYSCCASI